MPSSTPSFVIKIFAVTLVVFLSIAGSSLYASCLTFRLVLVAAEPAMQEDQV
jgi:hypothetical protein